VKLQQLRALAAIVQNDLNITAAAARLSATQPAVSKQLKLLEDELGFSLFVRSGRTLTGITRPGEGVVTHALKILRDVQNIKGISEEFKHPSQGSLAIGTTHTQARYVLPPVIQQFRAKYPGVQFHLHQGTSEQIAEMARIGQIDFAIATGSRKLFSDYLLLPWYQWYRRIVVPRGHELAGVPKPALQQLAEFPIVTYVFSFTGPSSLHETFGNAGLRANVALTARDADVIKTYVRLGLGVGIVAGVALDRDADQDLVALDASHLFPVHTTWIGFARGVMLRTYMYHFLQLCAQHLSRRLVDRAMALEAQEEVDALFAGIELPIR
jgi:LysR family transcriptional regulator, cys regulon transcriptional activator